MSMMLEFWQSLPSRAKRIITIGIFFAVAILVTASGTLTPLSRKEAEDINTSYNQTTSTLNSMSFFNKVTYIFGNNFMICLLAFVPLVGALFEFYVLYSTGVVIAAISYNQAPPLLVLLMLFIFPYAWLEFLAYSTGIAESFWLFWRIIKHKGKREIMNACIFISLCAVILLVAALVEVAVIEWFYPA
jgi:hypothetical protein